MSIYKDCSRACRSLAKKSEIFTEIDVANLAGRHKNWGKTQFKEAIRQANQIVSAQYRASQLVRFGPVHFNDAEDYARVASKIAYAGVSMEDEERKPIVDRWETPNGVFSALFVRNDTMGRTGRRPGNNRDDSQSWEGQEVQATREEDSEPRPKGSGPPVEDNPVNQLRKRLEDAQAEVAELQAKLAEQNGTDLDKEQIRSIAEDAVQEFVGDLDTRLNKLEEIEDRRRRLVYEAA